MPAPPITDGREFALNYTAYLFEARSIQSYILDGGRLADQVAASNLVDALCRDPLKAALEVLGLHDVSLEGRLPGDGEVTFPRCAGGAFYSVFGGDDAHQNANRLRNLWGIAAAAYCPGLEFVHALADGDSPMDAVTQGTVKLVQARNRPPAQFPETPPLARRAPRTGRPAILNDRLPENAREWSDMATVRKRRARNGQRQPFKLASGLTDRFLPEAQRAHYEWPRNLEPNQGPQDADDRNFPFLPDNAYVAVIHADGNGLGQALMALRTAVVGKPESYQRIFRKFSECIEQATIAAAQAATLAVLKPKAREIATTPATSHQEDAIKVMPARPIVLGGDDLTIIVRADLALPFTVAFLKAFEGCSKVAMEPLCNEIKSLEPGLTACAGVVFIKASQPFRQANHLAEELCARAKRASDAALKSSGGGNGTKPSSLAFTRITTSVLDETVREVELEGGVRGRLGATAYFIGDYCPTASPRWDDLDSMAKLLAKEGMARGPTRQLLSLLQSPPDAIKRYRRWREVLQGDKDMRGQLDEFNRLLAKFGNPDSNLPFVSLGEAFYTPISDALALRAVGSVEVAQTEESHV